MARKLLDLPEELLLCITRQLFVYEALCFTSSCRRLRYVGLNSTSLWLRVLRSVPVPLSPGLTLDKANGAQLQQAAVAAAAMHVRWCRSPRIAFRKQVRLTSSTAGDSSMLVLLHLIRGGRWAVTCTSSGRVVIWDLSENTPRTRHQIMCTPYSLDDRTTALDEHADGTSAVFAVSFAVSGKRFLRVLRLAFPIDGAPTIEEAGTKDMSNARISFALAVCGVGSRVAVARMDASSHKIDLFVWDYAADVDLRLATSLVYLIDLSSCQIRITDCMLLIYGASQTNALSMSLVALPQRALVDIKRRKEDRYVHSAYQAPLTFTGVSGLGRMPAALNAAADELAFVLPTRQGASFAHHVIHISQMPAAIPHDDADEDAQSPVCPIPCALARSAIVGVPSAPASHKASPILGAGAKRALWVSSARLYGAALCAPDSPAPRELELPADVARAIGAAERIAFDEAWSVVAIANESGQIWALYY